MNIIETITDWPVIFQGVLGSALFWFILATGQLTFRYIITKLDKDRTSATAYALLAYDAPPELKELGRFFCLYGAFHYTIKALIVFVVSFAIEDLVQTFAIVGYFLATYFLFRALSFVPHSDSLGSSDERKKKLKDILSKIKTNI